MLDTPTPPKRYGNAGNTVWADGHPAERLRQHQRDIAKAQRELDRERAKLEQQEKKLIMDITKSAKAG
ncbi:uncharacterized protein C8Q71DRAFT_854394 [Rhodofomes roseus]|uniref:Transposase n=1 Tax=Rhodofomes roseus TaxID=34475 RepID=A0ABQ8KT48_9APHY|nr:uncharacterized protein C8Q71DRAFT_885585 [Rhodofomes roseus]XP_047783340.1 uncharacterized protein C8Q71DRAFT_854394 [Rhodofomes roseus]KAH9842018.1 hypothetical protein C8Q71DRAFT_885585 [Rhodofomes roseus]KAH9842041.1 hypothetical protein C8Q71DRAFT_854394 [Rhodofomes roseus]